MNLGDNNRFDALNEWLEQNTSVYSQVDHYGDQYALLIDGHLYPDELPRLAEKIKELFG